MTLLTMILNTQPASTNAICFFSTKSSVGYCLVKNATHYDVKYYNQSNVYHLKRLLFAVTSDMTLHTCQASSHAYHLSLNLN